jgi:hypothetical protein
LAHPKGVTPCAVIRRSEYKQDAKLVKDVDPDTSQADAPAGLKVGQRQVARVRAPSRIWAGSVPP